MHTRFNQLLNDKRKLERRKYRMVEVARLTHISRQTLSFWYRDDIEEYDGRVLDALCYWLACTPSDLLVPDVPHMVQKAKTSIIAHSD